MQRSLRFASRLTENVFSENLQRRLQFLDGGLHVRKCFRMISRTENGLHLEEHLLRGFHLDIRCYLIFVDLWSCSIGQFSSRVSVGFGGSDSRIRRHVFASAFMGFQFTDCLTYGMHGFGSVALVIVICPLEHLFCRLQGGDFIEFDRLVGGHGAGDRPRDLGMNRHRQNQDSGNCSESDVFDQMAQIED